MPKKTKASSKRNEPTCSLRDAASGAYDVRFFTGDYKERQEAANAAGCVAYVEHHFNSSENQAASYALVVTGANASRKSREWGRWYAQAVASEFGIRVGGEDGIIVGGYSGRGGANLVRTRMPAILLEPLFVSNPAHVTWIRGEEGQRRLAQILADSIRRFFPAGGPVGFSVGHKARASRPDDRGAPVCGGGWEADYAQAVLERAETLLTSPVDV